MSLKRIETKLDDCLDQVGSINTTQQLIQADLSHHIKRTDILESRTNKIWYLIFIALGFSMANYGPGILKILGLII